MSILEKAVSRTLVLRVWNIISGLCLIVSIPAFLSPVEQGYYYTFASVIGIQVFFELGLGQVLLYKFAGLQEPSSIKADAEHESSWSLLALSRVVYRWLGGIFWVVSSVVGLVFFAQQNSENIGWEGPWIVVSAATSLNLVHSVKLIYLEAIGSMHHISVARLRSNIVGVLLVYLVLTCGAGLWAAAVIPTVNAIWFSFWLLFHRHAEPYRSGRQEAIACLSDARRLWIKEVFPMQWRMSLSWLSGYFIFQLYTPIVFNRYGSMQAGKIGYTMSVMSSMIVVCSTFTTALAPRLSNLYAAGRVKEYNSIFDRSFLRSTIALTLSICGFILISRLAVAYDHPFASRLLVNADIALYGLSALISGVINSLAIYLRSQQKEPLVALSVCTSVAMTCSLVIASGYSIRAMLLASLFVQIASVIWTFLIYQNNRRQLKNIEQVSSC